MGATYYLMSSRLAKQDYSAVEKIHLCKEQIFQLCHDFCPGLIRVDKNGWKLQQPTSSNRQFSVIGFYGNKEILKLLYSQQNFSGEEIQEKMESGQLEPGVYAWWQSTDRPILCVWYWHNGQEMEEDDQRSSLSCSYVRYLFELCDVVYACIPVQASALRRLGVSGNLKQRRKQNHKVARVQASKDDVKITTGYTIPLKDDFFKCPNHTTKFVKFCQNAQKPGLLISRTAPAIPSLSPQALTLDTTTMKTHLSSLKTENNFNLLKLEESQLQIFLRLLGLEEEFGAMNRELDREKFDRKALFAFVESGDFINQQTLEWAIMCLKDSFGCTEDQISSIIHSTSNNSQSLVWKEIKRWFRKKSTEERSWGPTELSLLNNTGLSNVVFIGNKFYFDGASDISKMGPFHITHCGEKKSGPVIYGDQVTVLSTSPAFSLTFVFSSTDRNRNSSVVWVSDQFKIDSVTRLDVGEEMPDTSQVLKLRLIQEETGESAARSWVQELLRHALLTQSDVNNLQAQVYKDCLSSVTNIITDTFEKNIKPCIKNRLEDEIKAREGKNRKKNEDFLRKHFAMRTGIPTITMSKCVLEKKKSGFANTITIEFQMDEEIPEKVNWSIVECTPIKREVDMLLSNPDHVISSIRFTERPLAQLGPEVLKLEDAAISKSGKILSWAKSENGLDVYLGDRGHRIITLKRVVDLVAFDEKTDFIAFYCKSTSTIQIFKFNETTLLSTGIELKTDYVDVGTIMYMQFVPRGSEIVCIDEHRRVLIFNMKSKLNKHQITRIPEPYLQARVCPNDPFLLVISTKNNPEDVHGKDTYLWLEAFSLDGSLSKLASFQLDTPVQGEFDTAVVMFGSQVQLLITEVGKPEIVHSKVLKITSTSEVCEVHAVTRELRNDGVPCPEISYFYSAFQKYAITAPLIASSKPRKVRFCMLLDGIGAEMGKIDEYASVAQEGMTRLIRKKMAGTNTTLLLEVACEAKPIHSFTMNQSLEENSMAEWILHLMCLVPLQIARAENNSLKPLIGGFETASSINVTGALSLANSLEFGFFDGILNNWPKEVKVVSSMGKQSSGKSYLLNHLSGSFLDVAGGRCTDGVWMTIRPTQHCMYVMLDFEGLGSFERSDQEDMLLSVLNAAISNITIYNKREFQFDKDTEAVFNHFQTGVSLINEDDKLFKGLFCIALKDVPENDIDELIDEFSQKLSLICSRSQDNFFLKMYGGDVQTLTMPPFEQPEFYDFIQEIAQTIQKLTASYGNGRDFLRDFKLLISQISLKDWGSIDSMRIAFKLDWIRQHLNAAVTLGVLAGSGNEQLSNCDTGEPLSISDSAADTPGLQLSPYLDAKDMDKILESLQLLFEKDSPREQNDIAWHQEFGRFLVCLAERRWQRVLDWIEINTKDLGDNVDVKMILQDVEVKVSQLKQSMTLCSWKCEHCFFKCVRTREHLEEHSCKGSHKCTENCTYCKEEANSGNVEISNCADVAGHEGFHDCKLKAHTCNTKCQFYGKSPTCNTSCSKKLCHDGEHTCNSSRHSCGEKCRLPICKKNCHQALDSGEHDIHECDETTCPCNCSVGDCTDRCRKEHLHFFTDTEHFCDSQHRCKEKCEANGNCEVRTECLTRTATYEGKRSTFTYDFTSEQKAIKKNCCIPIPAHRYKHDGAHMHSLDERVVHLCEARCQGCDYFCNRNVEHDGLHDTQHGNMREKIFVGESEDIDIGDRKYALGDSGIAEMCMMHCRAQGRGHIHLIKCLDPEVPCAGIRLPQGARHQTREYGPHFWVKKDELTHEAYWENMGFVDPTSSEEKSQFKLCNYHCDSTDHQDGQKSYCTEKLWHQPVQCTASERGSISVDGHRLTCKHKGNHVIFVIDRSGSMARTDQTPQMRELTSSHDNRLGCVYEAIKRFALVRLGLQMKDCTSAILFDHNADIIFENRLIEPETMMSELMQFGPAGGTEFYQGLQKAKGILDRYASNNQKKSPVVIFLSDGAQTHDQEKCVGCINSMKKMDGNLVVHTVKFGEWSDDSLLKAMAAAGGGNFQLSLDATTLANVFENFASTIRPLISSLMEE